MSYIEKLDIWFAQQKATGRVLDIKFFPMDIAQSSQEKLAQAVYKIVLGLVRTNTINTSNL